jgi:hypothetical protein
VPLCLAPAPSRRNAWRLRSDGRIALELKQAWHDGTRELVFEPLELLERLAAMTPRPETNLLICHGLLAARARWRARVVGYGRVEPTALAPVAAGPERATTKTGSRAWSWAALMHRAFALDVLACPHCGGRLRLIATLHDPVVIPKLLAHLGMARSGPSPGPAPPESRAVAAPSRPDRLLGGAAATVVPAPRGVVPADPSGPFVSLTAAVCPLSVQLTAGRARLARQEANVRCAWASGANV